MLPFFTFAQPACSQDSLDSTFASSDAPPPVPEPSFPEPYTPYIEKDDARQYNLPYQPFQVMSSEGELLNITFADFARESDLKEVDNSETYPDGEIYTPAEDKEPSVEPVPEPEPCPEPEQDESPPARDREYTDEHNEEQQPPLNEPEQPFVEESPFEYHRFVPDESCISAYLEHNVQHYQPFDHYQQQPTWSEPQPAEQTEWEAPALPRFLTIPENDPRQGHHAPSRESSPERHFQTSDESWSHQHGSTPWEGHHHYHHHNNQSQSDSSWHQGPETNQASNESDWKNEPEPISLPRAPSPAPPPETYSASQPEPPSITRSKSMSYLVIDATDTSTFLNIVSWKSQPDVNQDEYPVETPKKLPGLKPLLPKVKSPSKPEVMPKYTEFTEVNMVSEVSDPFAPPVDKLGFVERAIMKRVQSRKDMFDVPQGALEPAPPPEPAVNIRRPSLLQEMNEYVELAECKRQAGNPLMEPEEKKPEEAVDELKTFSPRLAHRREKRSTRRAAEKWKPPETSSITYDVDAILKRLSALSTGSTQSPPQAVVTPVLTNGSAVHSDEAPDFSKNRDYVVGRVEVAEKGLAAFGAVIDSNEPVWRTETPADRLFRESSPGLENLSTKIADRGLLPSSGKSDSIVPLSKNAERRKSSKRSEKSSSRKKASKTELSGKFGPISKSETFSAPEVTELLPANASNPFAAPPGESLSEMDGSVPEIVVCVASPEEEVSEMENIKGAQVNLDRTYIVANKIEGEALEGDLSNGSDEKLTLEKGPSEEVIRTEIATQSDAEAEFVEVSEKREEVVLTRNGDENGMITGEEVLSPIEKIEEVFGNPVLEEKVISGTPTRNSTESGTEISESSESPDSFVSAVSNFNVSETSDKTALTEVRGDETAYLPQTNGASFDVVIDKIGRLTLSQTSTPKTNGTDSATENETEDERSPAMIESFADGMVRSVLATENKSEGVEPESEPRILGKKDAPLLEMADSLYFSAVEDVEMKERQPNDSQGFEFEEEGVETELKERVDAVLTVASQIFTEPTITAIEEVAEPMSEFVEPQTSPAITASEVVKTFTDSLVEPDLRRTEIEEEVVEPLSENVQTLVPVSEFEPECPGVVMASEAEPVNIIPEAVDVFTADNLVDGQFQQVVTEEAVTDFTLLPSDEKTELPLNENEVLEPIIPAESAETLPEAVQNIEISEDTLKFDLSKLVSDVDELALSNLETSTPSEKGGPFFERAVPSSSLKWSEKPAMSYAAAARKESSGVTPSSSPQQPTTFHFMPAAAPQQNELKRPRKSQGTKKKAKPQLPTSSVLSSNEPPALSPVKHVKRKIEKLEVEVELPANRFELLPADTPELLTQHKKKVKKTVKRFAAPSSSTSCPSFPSSSQSESIVLDTEEEPQLYLPEPDDSVS